MVTNPEKKLYSAKEIAEIYGLKVQQILYMLRTKKIESVQIGVRYYCYANQLASVFGVAPNDNLEQSKLVTE